MAKSNHLEVICVNDPEHPRNSEFVEILKAVPNGRMIDFYTQEMEELSLIAKHRILPVPTFIVLCNGRPVCRVVHPPSNEHLCDILERVVTAYTT